jgi:hypothetical protein
MTVMNYCHSPANQRSYAGPLSNGAFLYSTGADTIGSCN